MTDKNLSAFVVGFASVFKLLGIITMGVVVFVAVLVAWFFLS